MRSNLSNIVDLMKTSNGYSVYENDILLNKPATSLVSSTPSHQTKQTLASTNKTHKQQKSSTLSGTKKLTPQQQSFTIYPYIYSKLQQNHHYLIIPSTSQWFDLHTVHQIEKKQLPQWFKQKKTPLSAINHSKFEKNQELYKKYRNYIIELSKTQYVSPTIARKSLAGDASAIMRIQKFLQKWGLINFVHKKPHKQPQSGQQPIQKDYQLFNSQHSYKRIKKDGFDKDKSLISKIYDKDDCELLKKITLKFRPLCESCECLCGISWYEYSQKLIRKNFYNALCSTKIVESSEQFEFKIKVCNSCFYERKFPVVLGHEDFTKRNLLSDIKEVDFEQIYGKKKMQQLQKLADVLQRNRFNLKKSSDELKIEEKELMSIYLQMPVHYLQKISRIDVQTEDESVQVQPIENSQKHKKQQAVFPKTETNMIEAKQEKSGKLSSNQQVDMLEQQIVQTQKQGRKIYEEFIQAWLLKMYVKMEELQKWDKCVQWRLFQNQSVKKHNLVQDIKRSLRKIQQQ